MLLDVYLIDWQRVHLGGWSGGAFLAFGAPFYTQLPFRGGLVGVCGGDIPRQDSDIDWCEVDEFSDDPALQVRPERAAELAYGRRVYVARNDDDDWVSNIDAGADFWQAAGASVRSVSAGEGGHCALPVVRRLVEGLEWVAEPSGGATP